MIYSHQTQHRSVLGVSEASLLRMAGERRLSEGDNRSHDRDAAIFRQSSGSRLEVNVTLVRDSSGGASKKDTNIEDDRLSK